ncbi:hypothetical protein BS47DRAFT_1395700 [Hydnum rufescens UP504]|uniref:Uncharacterized protein n=1 Tax=Hydnum rufescens UP504 TaxID=1448309 RepID=A0A9P6DUL4_9AGAM|nr:hypothetical protein BS47DRAFT_1395700 [Hydnum rufescens UP504]
MNTPTDSSNKTPSGQPAQGVAIPGVKSVVPERTSQRSSAPSQKTSSQPGPSNTAGLSHPAPGPVPSAHYETLGVPQTHVDKTSFSMSQLADEIRLLQQENARLHAMSMAHGEEIHSLKRKHNDSNEQDEGNEIGVNSLRDLLSQAASIISTSGGQPSPTKVPHLTIEDIVQSSNGSFIHDIIKLSVSKGQFVALSDITPRMCRDTLDKPGIYKKLPPTVVHSELGPLSFIDSGNVCLQDSALSKDDWRDAWTNLLFVVRASKGYDDYLQKQLATLFDILLKSKYFVLQFPVVARTCYKA